MSKHTSTPVDAIFAGALSAFLVGWFTANTSLLEGFGPLLFFAVMLGLYFVILFLRSRADARRSRAEHARRARQQTEQAYIELEAKIAAEESEWPLFARWLLVVMQANGAEVTRLGDEGYLIGAVRVSQASGDFGTLDGETMAKVHDAFLRLVKLGAIQMMTRGSGRLSALGYERAGEYAGRLDPSVVPREN